METESFIVLNIKCGGCVNTIRNGLMEMPGVESVNVDQTKAEVTVRGTPLVRLQLAERLTKLGYPEAK